MKVYCLYRAFRWVQMEFVAPSSPVEAARPGNNVVVLLCNAYCGWYRDWKSDMIPMLHVRKVWGCGRWWGRKSDLRPFQQAGVHNFFWQPQSGSSLSAKVVAARIC